MPSSIGAPNSVSLLSLTLLGVLRVGSLISSLGMSSESSSLSDSSKTSVMFESSEMLSISSSLSCEAEVIASSISFCEAVLVSVSGASSSALIALAIPT